MSEYKFKNLSEINTVAEPAEGTTMMGFEMVFRFRCQWER